jgi:alpha-D-xyloside xylohydrolase
MFGPDILVAPVMELGLRMRPVYLPAGETWIESHTGKTYEGGQAVEAEAPLTTIPVFIRKGSDVDVKV